MEKETQQVARTVSQGAQNVVKLLRLREKRPEEERTDDAYLVLGNCIG